MRAEQNIVVLVGGSLARALNLFEFEIGLASTTLSRRLVALQVDVLDEDVLVCLAP